MSAVYDAFYRRWNAALLVIGAHDQLGPLSQLLRFGHWENATADLHDNPCSPTHRQSWSEIVVEILIVSMFLAFFGLSLTVILHQNTANESFDVDDLLENYIIWVLIFLLTHSLVALLLKFTHSAASPTLKIVATLVMALCLVAGMEWWPLLPRRVVWEYSVENKIYLSPPANWVIEQRFPSGRNHVQTYVPPRQCSAQVSQIMFSVQYLCGGKRTIHGLWYTPQTPCTNCQSQPSSSSRRQNNDHDYSNNATKLWQSFDFSQRLLNESGLVPDLERVWPNCIAQNTNEQFWRHEWEKHGSCTGLPVALYFALAMDFYTAHVLNCPIRSTASSRDCRLCFAPPHSQQGIESLRAVPCRL